MFLCYSGGHGETKRPGGSGGVELSRGSARGDREGQDRRCLRRPFSKGLHHSAGRGALDGDGQKGAAAEE